MSLTLPIQALATTQVSFKIKLMDGKFTFDMIRENGAEIPGLQSESEKKLQLYAVRDSEGIILTIRVSREVEDNSNDGVELGGIYEDMNPQQILLPKPREHSLEASIFPRTADPEIGIDMNFLSHSPKISDMTLRLFDVPDALSGFNMTESLFSALTKNILYDCRDYFNPGIPSAGSPRQLVVHCPDPPDVSPGISNSSTTDDTSSSAPSTPSEIPASPRGAPPQDADTLSMHDGLRPEVLAQT
ncbi:hypothetical protein B0H17DRAFT_1193500 [Mycena rosella]|uniref:Uncharacterized protein n=1 Tax=Mycena rosella TaxID=1033263 RepID=A0AAD7GTH6_MYCRO|nr:hypothetical protein B0H17DRAFT_1193500 [Mycena rosella]